MWQDTKCLGSHEEKKTVDAWRVVMSRLYVQIEKKTVSLLSKSLLPFGNLTGLWLPCPDDLVWVEQAERVERLLELFVVVSLRSSRRSNRYWEYARGKTNDWQTAWCSSCFCSARDETWRRGNSG